MKTFNHLLQGIHEKVHELAQLNILWQLHIEKPLSQHTRVANWRNRCLIIEVESAVWATRLRYATPELIKKLRQEKAYRDLLSIEWYILPVSPSKKKTTKTKPKPVLTTSNAELLRDTALHLENEALKQALKNLARRESLK